jgi:hypothetical protein
MAIHKVLMLYFLMFILTSIAILRHHRMSVWLLFATMEKIFFFLSKNLFSWWLNSSDKGSPS